MSVRAVLALAAGLVGAALASAAPAQVTVFSSSGTGSFNCSLAAKHGNAMPEAINGCTRAMRDEGLSGRELAGTLTNRGVLYLIAGDYSAAEKDFNDALSIDPGLGEAWVNRGASAIARRQWTAGVADIDKGLQLDPEQPEKAYFNRALAREYLDDLPGAYADYMKATELAPTWELPRAELKRFTVASKVGG